jgi:hypothetical protein
VIAGGFQAAAVGLVLSGGAPLTFMAGALVALDERNVKLRHLASGAGILVGLLYAAPAGGAVDHRRPLGDELPRTMVAQLGILFARARQTPYFVRGPSFRGLPPRLSLRAFRLCCGMGVSQRRNASQTCDNAIDQLSQRLPSLGAGPSGPARFFV